MQVRNTVRVLGLLILLLIGCGNSNAGMFEWVMTLDTGNSATDIAADSQGNFYVLGRFEGTVDFNPRGHRHEVTAAAAEVYLACYGPDGRLKGVNTWGGRRGIVMGRSVTCSESQRAVYVTGYYCPDIDLDPGGSPAYWGPDDYTRHGYVARFDLDGRLIWFRKLEGIMQGQASGELETSSLAVDDKGNVYVSGNLISGGIDFGPGSGVTLMSDNSYGVFLAKCDRDGLFQWARFWPGGSSIEIVVDGSGNSFIAGFADTTVDLDPGEGTLIVECEDHSKRKSFLLCMDTDGSFKWGKSWDGFVFDVARSESGDLYTAGEGDMFLRKYSASGDLIWQMAGKEKYQGSSSQVGFWGDGNICAGGGFGGGYDPESAQASGHNSKDGFFLSFFDPEGNCLDSVVAEGEREREGIRAIGLTGFAYDGGTGMYVVVSNNGKSFSFSPHGPTVKKGDAFIYKLNLERME